MNGQFKHRPFQDSTPDNQEVDATQTPPSERRGPGVASSPPVAASLKASLPGMLLPTRDKGPVQSPENGSMLWPHTISAPMPNHMPTSMPGIAPSPPQISSPPENPMMQTMPIPVAAPTRPGGAGISYPSGPAQPQQPPFAYPSAQPQQPPFAYPPAQPQQPLFAYSPAQPRPVMSAREEPEALPPELLTVAPPIPPVFLYRFAGRLPGPLRLAAIAILTRATDAQPETLNSIAEDRFQATEPAIQWGWTALLTLIGALGLFLVNIAYDISRTMGAPTLTRYSEIEVIFFGGLLLIFGPIAMRLLSASVSRPERIFLLCIGGLMFYLVQMTNSPLHFANFNEFLHWHTADSIAMTGHLYRDDNTLLPVSTYYPGLEIVTNALSSLSGLHTFHAGLIVLGVARLLIMLSLFSLYERVTRSARLASIATIIYATNPHFISFDVQFSYESMALPLAAFMLFAMSLIDTLPYKQYASTAVAWLALAALAITHHMTDYVFDGFLLLWVFSYHFQRRRHHYPSIVSTALFSVFISVAVALFIPNNPAITYLSSYFGGAFVQLAQVIAGTSQARALFQGHPGLQSPLWDHVLAGIGVVIIMLALPFGTFSVWLRARLKGLPLMFGIAAFIYPLTQAFRFTSFGSEITDRSAAFLFIPISYALALLIVQFWPLHRLKPAQIICVSGTILLIFLSGVVLQAGPGLSSMPGSYLVSADNRSIEPQGIQDATWAAKYLGPANRVATDRINRLLMSTYGQQYVISNLDNKVDTSPVFFAPTLDASDVSLLKMTSVRYLVVDMRLSTQTPLEGVYFEDGEPDSFVHRSPIPASRLTKFNAVPQINRFFDSGDIAIYDVGRLVHG